MIIFFQFWVDCEVEINLGVQFQQVILQTWSQQLTMLATSWLYNFGGTEVPGINEHTHVHIIIIIIIILYTVLLQLSRLTYVLDI